VITSKVRFFMLVTLISKLVTFSVLIHFLFQFF